MFCAHDVRAAGGGIKCDPLDVHQAAASLRLVLDWWPSRNGEKGGA